MPEAGAVRVEPLTPQRWAAFCDLMADGATARRCWCAAPRIGADYRRRPPDQNQALLRSAVDAGPPPGVVALVGSSAVGWCQVTPRCDLPAVERAWRTRAVDDVPVWLISCFYIRRGHRRRGLTGVLIEGAVELARDHGAPAVEAYPLDGSVSPSATGTGYASTFAALGFSEIARRSPEKPIMRFTLS